MSRKVLLQIPIAARADQVWEALREREAILQWFGWNTPTLETEIEFIFFDHAVVDDEAMTLGFEGSADRFEVEGRGQQSILRVVRDTSVEPDPADTFEDMAQGWIAFAQQLKFAVEHHSLAERRTIYLSGVPYEAGEPLGAEALGLGDLPLVGQRYNEVVGPEDDGLTGHVWHRDRHQFSVSVDQWGNGLLVVMDRPADNRWPHGGTQVTLTTYGLDEAEFEALDMRWRDWWAENFATPT
jgi:hypothetical protein